MLQKNSPIRSEILESNTVPSPEECDVLRNSLIPYHAGRCSVLDAEIDLAQAHLEALLFKRQRYQDILDIHKAAVSPIRRVVPDVLLEIFHHCHSEFVAAPIRLRGVCQKWRELVLSTPTLWTLVLLSDTMPFATLVPFARMCTAYSGSCSIKVVVKFRHRPQHPRVRQALSEALAIIVRHSHRWQALEIFLDHTFSLDQCVRLPGFFPLLEEVALWTERSGTLLPFSHLPSLRDIRLVTMDPSQDLTFLRRSTQLRNLSIGGKASQLTLTDCWTILSNCTEIETFDIASLSLGARPVLPKGEITLPRLRELRIGPYTPDPTSLINCIKTPMLQRLRLILDTRRDFDSSCIQRLVQECRPPLTTLHLTNMDGAIVAAFLPSLPHVTSLLLIQPSSPDLVMDRLTVQDEDGGFICPMLVHFNLTKCLFTVERLIRLAKERGRAAGGLRIMMDGAVPHKPGTDVGLTIELYMAGLFTLEELEELRGLET